MNREEPLCSTLVTVTGPAGEPLTFMLSRWRGDTDAVGVELDARATDDGARRAIAGFSATWDPKQRSMRAPDPAYTLALRGFFGASWGGALARWIEASRRLGAVSDPQPTGPDGR